jgi:adenylylsulfate kinase-like enzyme
VDDPYEKPTEAEINIKNQDMTIQQSVDIIMRYLVREVCRVCIG